MNDTEKKAIEEMARQNCDIKYHMQNYKTCKECYETNYCACRVYEVCRNLYNAGYRKQSEGEWTGTNNLRHCSKCGNVVNFNNVSSWLYNYCPNCGAKMNGGE